MKPIVIRTDSRQEGTCRSCGAPIEWAVLGLTDKWMPFNPPIVLLPVQASFGGVDSDITEVDMNKTTSHFATCPQAKQWRRRR